MKQVPADPYVEAGVEVCHSPRVSAHAHKPASTYKQIFKSTALVGGSSAIDMALRFVRTKVVAVLLGPSGVGLFGIFRSIVDLTRTVAEVGINQSAMRQIAEAYGGNDPRRMAVTVTTVRRAGLFLGVMGAAALAILCKPVARLTFGDDRHYIEVLALSVVVLLDIVSEAQTALIRGLRRIGDLARLTVFAALFGTLSCIPLVYFYREGGIVGSIVFASAMMVGAAWWYTRKVKVDRVSVTWNELSKETTALLKFGFVLMLCAALPALAAYLNRAILQKQLGIEAAGYYQAAWALSVLYVNFILQAMGMDFYPRLTAASKDLERCNQMMNEQAEVALLLAGPGVTATLTFAPLVINIFYSAKFGPTVDLLRWNCFGLLLQVATWPLATLQLAQGRAGLFFWTQLAANASYVLLTWAGVKLWGLNGAAAGFCGMIAIQAILSCVVARTLSNFRWTTINLRLGLFFSTLLVVVFLGWYVFSFWVATVVGAVITGVVGVYSLRLIAKLAPLERMPRWVQKLIGALC